ncbi:chaplin [Peterkaempfera sp. SMS 1(5)a]|uniref:chaplin n=1 Tax=Peterkaempfera podocarpi TaxID=3232308 RepID=UPI00366D90D9
MKKTLALATGLSSALVAFSGTPAQALGGTAGNVCINVSSAFARGVAIGSPGLLSGNVVQIPINMPLNLCGNSIDIVKHGGHGGGGGGPE